jgi:hypothetical protein
MSNKAPNHLKYLLATKAIDFLSDSFVIILMATGFVFDPDVDALYTDVSADELAAGNGYLVKTKALSGVTVTEDDTNDRCSITWSNVSWTASGGPIGPTPGAIILDTQGGLDAVIGYIDFGAEYTQADGGVATISAIEVRIS